MNEREKSTPPDPTQGIELIGVWFDQCSPFENFKNSTTQTVGWEPIFGGSH